MRKGKLLVIPKLFFSFGGVVPLESMGLLQKERDGQVRGCFFVDRTSGRILGASPADRGDRFGEIKKGEEDACRRTE